MKVYKVKAEKLKGSSFKEVNKKARKIYEGIKKQSKRKPHIKSAYFKKEKIFLNLFWGHLFEKKHFGDLMRRIRFYPCALELIKKSKFEPNSKTNPNKPQELLHRFGGITNENELFFVQIKENKKSRKKWLISIFPIDN